MLLKENGSNFTPPPTGSHVARCVSVIDLGTRIDFFDEAKQKKKRDVYFMFELPNEIHEFTKDGQTIQAPFTASKFYNASLNETANLRKDLESWRSRPFTAEELAGFDPKKVLGVPCMVTVMHKPKKKGGINAVIANITPLPKGMTIPDAAHELVYFSLDDFSQESFNLVSEGLQKMIMGSDEYQAMSDFPETAAPAPAIPEDDIPFIDPYKFTSLLV